MEKFQIHKLAETETIKTFDCGDEDLNDFILHEASLYRKAKLVITYIVIDVENNQVVAYLLRLMHIWMLLIFTVNQALSF